MKTLSRPFLAHGSTPLITIKWMMDGNKLGWMYARNGQTFYDVTGNKYHWPKWCPFINDLQPGIAYTFITRYTDGKSRSGGNWIPTMMLLEHPNHSIAERFQELMWNKYIKPNDGNVPGLDRAFYNIANLAMYAKQDVYETMRLMNLPLSRQQEIIDKYRNKEATEEITNNLLEF